ncbi:MAG: glutamate--tRNA ligase family protein, partial [Cyanobacteria bacterium J06636_16]
QILLYEALGGQVPEFSHTPLILNQSGQKLSKRDGVTSISDFQKMGFTAAALANYMTLLGWSAPDAEELFTLNEAAPKFSFDRVNKAGAKFDWDKLDWINSQYLHKTPAPELLEMLVPYLQEAGYTFDMEADKEWLTALAALVGPSLSRLPDVVDLSRFFFTEIVAYSEAATKQLQLEGVADLLQATLEKLQAGTSLDSPEAGKALVNEVVKAQGVKKGLMMKSMRAALMGDMQGPDLMESWLILHQRQFDQSRLAQALKLAQA